jgi:RimJ/RimL family protein N-acetyltransferase
LAGIKLLSKRPEDLNYIINELLKPELRTVMFDDSIGMAELVVMLYEPFCFVYGIFEKGHPVPIGCVILENLRPFRGCELHAVIFKPENRKLGKMQHIASLIKGDLTFRWHLHYAEARALSTNVASKHLLEKLGFTKIGTKPGNVFAGGAYQDVDEYYYVLNGDALLDLSKAIQEKGE